MSIAFLTKHLGKTLTTPPSPEFFALLERQRQAFMEKFQREPGPHDPVFFDPRGETPRPLPESRIAPEIVALLRRNGFDPSIVYCYSRTGFRPCADNWANLTEEQKAEWRAAFQEVCG